ncbi:aldo/keto reductase [Halobacillus sp. A5]|uniref:aldo/keto reductase n=1 Tax=Halobacillus sp. A5 TaxID=2880263 RepID=UPI0020A648B2|nr:aldo/keto reductase [Halobacillus sp. A5]MCP3028208.1 aldo/keto reductase [Halobacillus sp. A5]
MVLHQGEEFKRNLKKVDQIRGIAREKGAEVSHLVLALYLTRDSIDAIIPGTKRKEQVVDNLRTLNLELSADEAEKINQIFK